MLSQILKDMDRQEDEFYDMVLSAFEEKKKDYSGFGPSDGNLHLYVAGVKKRDAHHVILNKDQIVLKK